MTLTHQSIVLLWTLTVMAGIAVGYWLAWCEEVCRPFVAVLLLLFGIRRTVNEITAMTDSFAVWQYLLNLDEVRA